MNLQKIFILGNPRSGTSLLRIMLNAHPDILAAPESGFMQWWYDKYRSWTKEDSYSIKTVDGFITDILSSKKIEDWKLKKNKLQALILEEKPENYGDLCSLIYVQRGRMLGKIPRVIIDKNNYYIHHLETISSIWPEAKYIFLIRDGRDVACSYLAIQSLKTNSAYKPKLPGNINDIAREWIMNNKAIATFLDTRPSGHAITLRYEDIVNQTETFLKDLTDYIGVDFNMNMLEYYKFNDEPKNTMDWKLNTLKQPDKHNIGKYKNILSKDDVQTFNTIAGHLLKKYHYPLD